MRRSKIIGIFLLVSGFTVAPIYIVLVSYPWQVMQWLGLPVNYNTGWEVRILCAVIPVAIAVTALLIVFAFMGFNMVTDKGEEEEEKESHAHTSKEH